MTHAPVVVDEQRGSVRSDYRGVAIRSGEGVNRFPRIPHRDHGDFDFPAVVSLE